VLMDSNDYRILVASCVELRETYEQQRVTGQYHSATALYALLESRLKRVENGRFHTDPGDRGTPPHTN
jgi:predicted RNA-binding protein with EMAP domain